MTAHKWVEELQVPYYFGDCQGKMSIPGLMTYLIHVSGQQTAALSGPKAEDFYLSWIIIQYQFEIERLPQVGESVVIETTAPEYNRIFSYRQFDVYCEEGYRLAQVTTTFALMDGQRKLAKIPADLAEAYGSTYSRRIRRDSKPDVRPNDQFDYEKTYQVRYFDIDKNNHVNNAHYFEWLLDALPPEFLKNHEVKKGNIIFEKEVRLGEVVTAKAVVAKKDEDNVHTAHMLTTDQVNHAKAVFTWN